jgi:hydrogenase expression/formation protein HypE
MATVLNEVAQAAQLAIVVDEAAVPISPVVGGACELLGIDPLYVACEGRFVAVVDGREADVALAALRGHPLGEGARVVGRVVADPPGLVLLKTAFGGTRIVDLLVGDPLPRIC